MEDEQSNKKEKLKSVFSTFLSEYEQGLRAIREDANAVSKYTISKVKDIREKRRQRQPAPPGVADMLLDINPGAGSEILSHFKFQWDTIHNDIISSSDVLDTMHTELQKIFQSVNNSHKIITLAHEELAGLPSVIKSLEDTNIKVESIEQLMRGVEEDIVNYINISTQLEQERKKYSLLLQYEKFKETKDIEVKKWETIVAEEKQSAIDKQEEIEKASQKERLEALESMFQIQMAEYRDKGTVEKPLISDKQIKERTVSEVSVEGIEIKDENGNETLNDFLQDVINGDGAGDRGCDDGDNGDRDGEDGDKGGEDGDKDDGEDGDKDDGEDGDQCGEDGDKGGDNGDRGDEDGGEDVDKQGGNGD